MTQSGFLSTLTLMLMALLFIARQVSWFGLHVSMDTSVFYFLFYTLVDLYSGANPYVFLYFSATNAIGSSSGRNSSPWRA